jgi:hypothetical protein
MLPVFGSFKLSYYSLKLETTQTVSPQPLEKTNVLDRTNITLRTKGFGLQPHQFHT